MIEVPVYISQKSCIHRITHRTLNGIVLKKLKKLKMIFSTLDDFFDFHKKYSS